MTASAAQEWNAARYRSQCAFVADLGAPLLDLLAPKPGEKILDLGCGDGRLTARIAAAGANVLGADSSPDMVAATSALGLQARLLDGQAMDFCQEYDAVFSNAALQWMKNANAVIAGVRAALKPGGRFVGELGGFGNVSAIRAALHDALEIRGFDAAARSPWFFPSHNEYRARLEAHGFTVHLCELIPRPTMLPHGLRSWIVNFCDSFLVDFDEIKKQTLTAEIESRLGPILRDEQGRWWADYVRLRFSAQLMN